VSRGVSKQRQVVSRIKSCQKIGGSIALKVF
jgi:hypothetical protein